MAFVWRVAKLLAFLVLAAYFVTRVADSVRKLREGRIATSSTFFSAKTVHFPAMTFCPVKIDDKTLQPLPELDILNLPPVNATELVFDVHIAEKPMR